MTIREILIKYMEKLSDISDTPRLDTEILLQKALGNVDRLYIQLNLNKKLNNEELANFNKMMEDRLNGRPIAYIVNNREFMGLDFYVEEGCTNSKTGYRTTSRRGYRTCRQQGKFINSRYRNWIRSYKC